LRHEAADIDELTADMVTAIVKEGDRCPTKKRYHCAVNQAKRGCVIKRTHRGMFITLLVMLCSIGNRLVPKWMTLTFV